MIIIDEQTYNELKNEIDMLQGNINRMMISDDIKEIANMYYFATRRLSNVFKKRIDIVCKNCEN